MAYNFGAQDKIMSLVEANANAVIGLMVSWVFTFWGLPIFGIYPSPAQATWITLCYFFLSMSRSYVIRRAFESEWMRRVRTEFMYWRLKIELDRWIRAFRKHKKRKEI
jgi:peroxiredoxin family protein